MKKIRHIFGSYDKMNILVLSLPFILVPMIYLGTMFFVDPIHASKMRTVEHFVLFFLPLALLFYIHDAILKLLYMRGRTKLYVASLILLLASFMGFAYWRMENREFPPEFRREKHFHGGKGDFGDFPPPPPHEFHGDGHGPGKDGKHHGPRGRKGKPMSNPILVDFILALLLVSFDFSANIVVNYTRERKRNELLEHRRLENELQYLKAQLNPHFFMNTLNNIHGMVEINPKKAQEMVIELSKLMRYVLYEGERKYTTLNTEVEFIENYVALMRKRYSSRKVDVRLKMPDTDLYGIKLPPLLFMVMIENAFKHGISYKRHTDILIAIEVQADKHIRFMCQNSKREQHESDEKKYSGIGLKNLKKRLDLLYGSNYSLDIADDDDTYTVNLKIPYEYDDNDKVLGNR